MHFYSKINHENYFMFDKNLIKNKIWCNLPLSSRAVFPVIGVHCNKEGTSFPSQLTIGILCGLQPKAVSAGVRGLAGVPGFSVSSYVNSHGKNAHKYSITPAPKTKGCAFPIYRNIMDGGNWSQVSEVGKALYPVLRNFGYFTQEDCGGSEDASIDFMESFKKRDFELCEASPHILQDFSGLSRQSIYNGLKSLQEASLIERYSGVWKVFLHPDQIFKRDFLNAEVQKRFKCEIRGCLKNTDSDV